jgi:hypothetical protein
MQQGNGVLRAGVLGNTLRWAFYEDYFHLKQTASNSADIGSRVGTGIRPHVKTEGEMAHDFDQAITGVGGDLARGIELAAWRVWAQTGTS